MKNTVKAIFLSAFFMLVSTVSFAKSDVNPWQDCGIGATIFPDNGAAAAISNIIWDSGTTAVTSASASEDSCSSTRVKTAQFINEAYDNIEEDLVKGQGEHLAALAKMMSCSDENQGAIRAELASNLADEQYTASATTNKAEKLFFIAEEACKS